MAPRPAKTCPVCLNDVARLSISPTSCKNKHSESQRACSDCWEEDLGQQVEEKHPRDIKCMFHTDGGSVLTKAELKKLARKGTMERYEEKLKGSTHFRCQARCWESKRDTRERNSPSVLQPHDRNVDGRVFICKFCSFSTCIDCDRPEHANETCDQYRARVVNAPQHVCNEAATNEKYERCPSCRSCWEWDPTGHKCGYTVCEACKYRFCGRCLVPWVGKDSTYELGKMAHAPDCNYRKEGKKESRHGLKTQFPVVDEVSEPSRGTKSTQTKAGIKRKAGSMEDEDEVVEQA